MTAKRGGICRERNKVNVQYLLLDPQWNTPTYRAHLVKSYFVPLTSTIFVFVNFAVH